jgi:hypothetical protein
MDFNQLMMKMRELDQPAIEGGCGMDSPMSPPLSTVPPKPDVPPPSMSVNINAQGLDNIEDMMKLFQKVNPDMMGPKEPMPTLGIEPSIMSIKPSMPPLKMLPDMDADNNDMPGGEKDHMEPDGDEGPEIKGLDRDSDGDHDMDDHDMEKKKDKEEAYANEPDEEEKDVDYMNNKLAGGMNRPKDTFPKVSDGDNPMQKKKFESSDLRSQIRAELLQRLAEAKGAQ